ncbi:heme exporter protein CcmB, partial [Pasteurella multocida]|uniref:heme exporter protein CcmB n=1 Tax=Pasteurella multocida TaxID=747 RepID=UPI003F72097B
MRKQADILNPFCFFFLVFTLFPLVIVPDPTFLSLFPPCFALVSPFFSSFLSFSFDNFLLSPLLPINLLLSSAAPSFSNSSSFTFIFVASISFCYCCAVVFVFFCFLFPFCHSSSCPSFSLLLSTYCFSF